MLKNMFCMRLQMAGILIGSLCGIGSLMAIIRISMFLENADGIARPFSGPHTSMKEAVLTSVMIYSFVLGGIVMNFFASILLVLGTIKNRHLLLLPWLINFGIITILSLICPIVGFFVLSTRILTIYFLMASGLIIVLSFYIYCGIYSLYKHIQSAEKEKDPVDFQTKSADLTNKYLYCVKF